jgi:hypothetical protein
MSCGFFSGCRRLQEEIDCATYQAPGLGIARKAPDELSQTTEKPTQFRIHSSQFANRRKRSHWLNQWPGRATAVAIVPALFALAGCTGGSPASGSNGTFSVSPSTTAIDTNCTGCNTTNSSGTPAEQFSATLSSGSAASVTWTLSGGDANSGPGTINTSGQYTPPPYLTANSVQVTVTATLSSSSTTASAAITITPGFLQPLSPENVALGGGATVNVTGTIAEAGGSTGINYALASSPTGSSGGQGTLGSPTCTRSSNAFTYCIVSYTAPGTITATAPTYIVATVGSSNSRISSEVLLNTAGISSSPTTHQDQEPAPVYLGTSGSNNNDYDTNSANQIVDCCGGTLGALIQSSGGTDYILSCNHVLARSDQASVGEEIIQPGLIDDGCYPSGHGGTETVVANLTAWLPLSSAATNADAAIAQVIPGTVNASGEILELGAPSNGALAPAAPGTSCTNVSAGTSCSAGKGETLNSTGLSVAMSGRTTGLTCASITAISLDVQVPYFKNCGETEPYLTKTYTNQIAIEANGFGDAGDSGSLVVDVNNAEPVGLFFAGGTVPGTGVSEGVANPASTVLSELGTQEGTNYTFVGTTDHQVSCINYGNGTATAAQATTLTAGQVALTQQALAQARQLVNPSAGILGAAAGKSNDHTGEAAVIVYVDQNMNVTVPQTIAGVRTEVIPTTAQAVAAGTAPQYPEQSGALPSLAPAVVAQAITAKQQVAQNLMKQNSAFFGVGVGQSFDNPKEAALVVYVDRRLVPATLAPTIAGLRVRYIIMERLHVTRSYQSGFVRSSGHCMPHAAAQSSTDLLNLTQPRSLGLTF